MCDSDFNGISDVQLLNEIQEDFCEKEQKNPFSFLQLR